MKYVNNLANNCYRSHFLPVLLVLGAELPASHRYTQYKAILSRQWLAQAPAEELPPSDFIKKWKK